MSESNSNPSDESNQEEMHQLVIDTSDTDAHGLLDAAMREKDTLLSPAPDHGWLEQFQAFGLAAWKELESVAGQGLNEAESELLVTLAVKLVKLAEEHDKSALSKFAQSYGGILPTT